MKLLIAVLIVTLTSCSLVSEALLKSVSPDTGISIDAQVGDTDEKVDTGIGSINKEELKTELTIEIEDSEKIEIQTQTQTGKYHLQSDKNLTVNVYETNKYLYLLFALWVVGKPLFRWWETYQIKKERR